MNLHLWQILTIIAIIGAIIILWDAIATTKHQRKMKRLEDEFYTPRTTYGGRHTIYCRRSTK